MNALLPPGQVSPPAATPIQVSELTLIGLLLIFFALWGFRHGLDAVILAGLFVLFGRVSVDVLAVAVGAVVNIFYGLFELFATGKFSSGNLFAVIGGDPAVIKPLVNVKDSNDPALILVGTVLFIMIAYIGFRFAVQKAGGKDTPIEQVFGLVGGAALGYLCLTYVISRHFSFPQVVEITQSDVRPLDINGPLVVVVILVLIVFGLQRTRPPAKKK